MDTTDREHKEEWTDEGVRPVLQQPEDLRSRRANVWLLGLIAAALAGSPVAFAILFVPAFAPFIGVSMLFVAAVFGWAFLPPLVLGILARPVRLFVGQGRLEVNNTVFERGSIRAVRLDGDELVVERRNGPELRVGPVAPVDPERLMHLLDCVELSDGDAAAQHTSKRAALHALRPLQSRASEHTNR